MVSMDHYPFKTVPVPGISPLFRQSPADSAITKARIISRPNPQNGCAKRRRAKSGEGARLMNAAFFYSYQPIIELTHCNNQRNRIPIKDHLMQCLA